MGRSGETRALATAAPSRLLPFCQYLLLRLKSDNLELLRRIVIEFHSQPPCFTAVESMLQLAFPIVALLPVAHDDANQQAQADAILSQMKQSPVVKSHGVSSDFEELRWRLSQKIELKNWDWLAQMYHEFCRGDDHCLQEFVRLQRQSIAIVPLAPRSSVYQSSTRSGRVSVGLKADSDADESRKGELPPSARTANKSKNVKPSHVTAGSYPVVVDSFLDEMRVRLFEEFKAVEKTKPWEKIFDVSKIEYPFNAKHYPLLAEKFKRFWRSHAFAVWERDRWPRLAASQEDEKLRRKWRQERASRLFESWVICPIFREFGPQFFVDFDKRPEPHYWWWDRRPVFELHEIGVALGEEVAIEYLRSTSTERFPKEPDGLPQPRPLPPLDGWTMFSTKPKYNHIRVAIEQAKLDDVEANGGE